MNLTVIPLTGEKKDGRFSFFDELKKILKNSRVQIKNEDVIVISSKFISNSQGRVLEISNSKICDKAKEIAEKFNSDKNFIEIVLELALLLHIQ